MINEEFIEFLYETFEEFGPIEARKMFGGYGIYFDGLMFALVENNVLYLKADESTRGEFESRGLPPFRYKRGGKMIEMSYYRAPEELFDDRGEAARWAKLSYEAAVKQGKKR